MFKTILKSWKENRGNLLLVFASVAGLLMCLVWYFELVPEVRLVARGISNTLVSAAAPHANPNALVGIIYLRDGGLLPSTSSSQSIPVVVEVYPPDATISEQLFSPSLAQSTVLPKTGGPVAVVFNDLPPGKYAAVAYIDLNENGRFDFDESDSKSEPFSLARVPGPASPSKAQTDEVSEGKRSTDGLMQRPSGIFEIGTGQVTLMVFDFEAIEPLDLSEATGPAASPTAPTAVK